MTNRSQLPCKWEVRARNVLPQPVMKVVVERSTPCERRMGKAIACSESLRDNRGKDVKHITQQKVVAVRAFFPEFWPMKCRFRVFRCANIVVL